MKGMESMHDVHTRRCRTSTAGTWKRCASTAAAGLGALLPLFFLLFSASCGRTERPDILLITLDTVRADHVGCYGFRPGLTPALDALAAEGVRFARTVAPVPITLPSHVSILTGLYPVRHGVRDNSAYYLEDDARTLAEYLSDGGYRTGAAVASIALSHRFGVNQGFGFFDEGNLIVRDGQPGGVVERDGKEITAAAERFLGGALAGEEPFFFWAHYYDAHEPYILHPDLDSGPADSLYAGEVRYADREVGRLLEFLHRTERGRKTVVVVTSDHGEGLGQHNERTHLVLVYESTLSVPLIMAGPNLAKGKVVEGCLARLVDLCPTLLDLAGLFPSGGKPFDGVSLAPLLREGSTVSGPSMAYFETMGPVSFDWSWLDGVTTLEWKYIRGPYAELYHLPDDPAELNNLVEKRPETAARLQKAAERFAAGKPAWGGVTDMAGRQSELFGALGYLSLDVRARKPSRNAPHPRDMVAVLDVLAQAQSFYAQGALKKALRLYEECIRVSPGTAMFHDFKGKTLLRLHDFEAAAEAFRKALEVHPDMVDTRLALGIALVNLGARGEAAAAFEEAIRLAPELHKSYAYLANLYRTEQRPAEELNALERMFRDAEVPAKEAPGFRAEMERIRALVQKR